MTIKEFQEQYHEYAVSNGMEAKIEAMKLRVVDEDGNVVPIIAVDFGGTWALMVKPAVEAIKEMGII